MTNENYFEIDKKGILIRYMGRDQDIVITPRIHGIPVREIGENAFFLAHLIPAFNLYKRLNPVSIEDAYNVAPFSVTLPEGITRIGDNAFVEAGLSEIIIPKSVKEIGISAFADNDLKKIVIPEGVIKIGWSAFSFNPLTEIVIPESLKEIVQAFGWNQSGANSFEDCYNNCGQKAGTYLFDGKRWIIK